MYIVILFKESSIFSSLPVLIISIVLAFIPTVQASETCNYSSYNWNTVTKQAEDSVIVSKSYSALLHEEIDAQTGCSVCVEDQRSISVAGLKPFKLCKVIANEVESILNRAVAQGFVITELTGYRVGRTRGNIDANGNRDGFSNHSFGIAIDVNPGSNGLYENCLEYNQDCVLRRGGKWQPEKNYKSITPKGHLVKMMKASGFGWGGEIIGRQKDFMHFSISGY